MKSIPIHIFLIAVHLSAFTLHAQTAPIDIEMVRTELLAKPHLAPEEFIKSLKPAMFKVMYTGNLAFVHIPYKSQAGDTFTRSSDLVVYRMLENKWTYENLIPAWYDVTLLDVTNLVFVAGVKFCDPDGSCKTYESLSYYDGKELFVVRDYKGFDKTLYYQGLNSNGNPNKIKFGAGDVVAKTFTLTDFAFEKHQVSFKLTQTTEAIASISKAGIKKKVTEENFQRVIVNL